MVGLTICYARADIFNIDKGLASTGTPMRTTPREHVTSVKQGIRRQIVSVCANANGSTELPLLLFVQYPSNASEPLSANYASTAKGWMTASFFCGVAQPFRM